MLKWKLFRSKGLALAWLLIMCTLFFLPGSALPKEDWLNRIYFDKWVHVGLFAVLIFLWRSAFDPNFNNYNWLLILSAIIYGLLVEVIQRQWVANRSFDLYDVLADSIGSVIGLVVWSRVYKK